MAVVIVNYGSHRMIAENLAGPLNEAPVEVVIVDNFSSDQELTDVRELSARNSWTLVANPKNDGFGGGMNIGVQRARELGADAFLLLNPDVEIDVQTMEALHRQVHDEPLAIASPAIFDSNGKPWFLGGELNAASGVVRTSKPVVLTNSYTWLTGACLAISCEMWDRCGGFDVSYFLYWEDIDFSQRCRRAGGALVVRDDLRVVHQVGGTQGSGKSPLYVYYNCRNRLLFSSRWLPARTQVAWIARTPFESYRILRRAGRRRSLLRWDLIWATTSGSVAGVFEVIRASAVRSH